MARYSGEVGFVRTVEVGESGVYEPETVEERHYYGDVIRNSRRWDSGSEINPDLAVSNQFSIVADKFAYANFEFMKYITYLGRKWTITSVDIQRPRMTITIGGLYHG